MELVWASEDFMIAGQPYRGFPILLWDSLESCTEANQFFRYYLLRGAIASKDSWSNTGRALYDFFSFLQAHEIDWRDVDRGESKSLLAAYRDYCLVTCELALNTTRQRLNYICKFYEFALRERWVTRLPFNYEERPVKREPNFLRHIDASGGKAIANDVMPRSHKSIPKFLSMGEVKSFLAATENPHHRMIICRALHTGIRREEVAAFPLVYVFDPDEAGRTERNLRIRLDPSDGNGMVTKGSKPRDIYVSRTFMAELYTLCHQGAWRARVIEQTSAKVDAPQPGRGTLWHGWEEPQPDHQSGRQTGWSQSAYAYAPAHLCHPYPD